CDQPQERAQRKEPKLFPGPKALRNGGTCKRGEKCLAQDRADRQEKNGDDGLDPFRRHHHCRWPPARSRPRDNQRNDLGLSRSVAPPSNRFSISCCHKVYPPESSQISAAYGRATKLCA